MYLKLLALLVVLIGAAAPLRAQSLADVSRAEEERRKQIKSPAKVYTNKDLASVPGPPQPVEGATDETTPAGESAEGTDEAAEAEDPAGEAPRDQAYWAGRAKALQTDLERNRSFAEALQSRINALTTDFENRADPAQRALVEQDRNRALTELERLRQAIADQQKAIVAFEDEARRAGVPPGWLR